MKKAEILAEIEKVKSNKFLPESVKQIKLKQLNQQLEKSKKEASDEDMPGTRGLKVGDMILHAQLGYGKINKVTEDTYEAYFYDPNRDKHFPKSIKKTSSEFTTQFSKSRVEWKEKVSGSEVKDLSKPAKKITVKKTSLSKIDWERDVIDTFAEKNEMTNSDAQGVYEANEAFMNELYNNGESPKVGAYKLGRRSSIKEVKIKSTFKFKGKDYTELDEMECNELIAHIQERRLAAKKSEKKTKSRPVIEKIATPIVRAVKTAVENIPAQDIKNKPKTELSRIDKAIAATKRFLMELKTIIGDDFDKDTVDDELKELHALSKELHKKYGN